MTTYTIDLDRVHSLYELHDHLEEVLPLPDYYGRNMDALCSGDLEKIRHIRD